MTPASSFATLDSMTIVLIRGIGDVASAVAHRFFCAGLTVVMHDIPRPAYTRRGMAFTDALFVGKIQLEGVFAKHARTTESLEAMVACKRAIPVTTANVGQVIDVVKPDVLVDARMHKRQQPEPQRAMAPLTVGLGPNFVAGESTDLVIETAYGEHLGRVIKRGRSLPLAGEPRAIAGHERDRFIYTDVAGEFLTDLQIGAPVVEGQAVARVGDITMHAPLTGRLRGLTRSGVWVNKGAKVIEVDPRGNNAVVRGLGERPARIAEGVFEAITERHRDT